MRRSNKAASALVITLAMIVLITILVVGFVATARLDVASARLHLDGVKADIYTRTGEEVALARLKAATSTDRFWISQPGRILASAPGTNQPLTQTIDLSSGWLSNAVVADVTVDLNPSLLENTNERLIFPPGAFGTNPPIMPVRWIYIRKDGTFETNAPPAYNAQNPVEGRFAFWVDDESTRINLNTAWTKAAGNTNTLSHPSRVSLNRLFEDPSVADIAQYRLSHFFNSPEEQKRAGAQVADSASSNRFLFTHYNHVPELNMFGEPRIMLTTQKRLAEGDPNDPTDDAPFLDILTNDNTDPGYWTNISSSKYTEAINNIAAKFARTDWPIAPGQNFFAKYGDPHFSVQTAMNIVDYVRSKESHLEVVAAIRGGEAKASPPYYENTTGNWMMGLGRRPLLTEVGVWLPKNITVHSPSKKTIYTKFIVEVYLPKGAGRIDLTKCTLQISAGRPTAAFGAPILGPIQPGPPPLQPIDGRIYLDSADPWLEEGNVRVITAGVDSIDASSRPSVLGLRFGLLNAESGKYGDMAPMSYGAGGGYFIDYRVDPFTPIEESGNVTSMRIVDPAANKSRNDWEQSSVADSPPNTFGRVNDMPASLPSVDPQRDEDAHGGIFTDGVKMPPPYNSSNPDPRNRYGIVESVGELGFIHTGINGSTNAESIPFRTLRLQPQKAGSTQLPDWAILDLFSVPARASTNEMVLVRPNPLSSGGRINLNNTVYPFVNQANKPILARPEPLNALTADAKKDWSAFLNPSEASGIADNIYLRTLAGGASNPGRPFANTDIYYSPWQIVEMANVAQSGEESEELLRQIGGLSSVRGNVFSIYAVGQAIRQAKDGQITVLSERRSQKIVERMTRIVGGATNTVYETVFLRELQP